MPAALLLLRVQREREAADETAEARIRRAEVLTVLGKELNENLADLDARTDPDGARHLVTPPLAVEVWDAVSAAGELRFLNDPELLRRMARADRFIGATRDLERIGWRTRQSNGWSTVTPTLAKSDEHTKAAMDHALASIESALEGRPLP